MRFDPPLVTGQLVRRYKRFLADVVLDTGEAVTAHVPNTGSMLSTSAPRSPVALSHHPDPKRKLKWTLELIEGDGSWVGVNTSLTNRIVEEALVAGRIGPLRGFDSLRREVPYGERSRVDLLLEKRGQKIYVEVKNVTYRLGRRALFPDAVTARGLKHLVELRNMVREGHRAVIFFLVNRGDCASMSPADEIDPEYGTMLREVVRDGVEALAYRTAPTMDGIAVERKVRLVL